ncbi:MAG: hypothetical protein CNC06_01415 [Pelagibacterales bacterium MED-G40]|nr:MAG: hypothetical protein CNC06_01415 [Pelagibacterales bacterium MED-G40]|tara:strand:+ start:34953 stop:36710 length:1758 start_codon:yes stop_codon:yes gene_type:complete
MRLLNLNSILYLFFFLILFVSKSSSEEESVDIWEKKEITNETSSEAVEVDNQEKKIKINFQNEESLEANIKISENKDISQPDIPLYGIYDPEENDLNLYMWKNTDGNEIKNIFKRINKIKLSKSSEEIFLNTIMTYSYLPQKNLSDKEFLKLKLDWLIENNKDNILEEFLNSNQDFHNRSKVIQYLVDKNIAKANLNEGCKKSEFINKEIKDSYLEKFKIYCLIFNDKKNEAQLIFDLLKEQKLSDSFFNTKINFLLGISEKADKKVKDDNLLNFYLSSITVPGFKYEPNEKTNKYIWEYLNAANLVTIEDFEDRDKIKTLELAANNNKFDKDKLFEIYKKISFDVNSLINAQGLYQSLDEVDARALIFQKYLLSDNPENRIKLLLLLKDISKRANLSNIFKEFISDNLKEIAEEEKEDIVKEYEAVFKRNIITEQSKLGKVKFDDKILHRSRVIRFYTDINTPVQKTQKDLNNVYKKIRKNKKYFFSAKDLALVESLKIDGFSIPEEIKTNEIAKQYSVPKNLLDLAENDETGLLALKFVEIIGEDEISILDPETIYFITNILNKAKLIKFRNQVITSALPLRS